MYILIYQMKHKDAKETFDKLSSFAGMLFKDHVVIRKSPFRVEIMGLILEIRSGDLNNLRGLKPDYVLSDTDWIDPYIVTNTKKLRNSEEVRGKIFDHVIMLDPVMFMTNVIGVELSDKQKEIVNKYMRKY